MKIKTADTGTSAAPPLEKRVVEEILQQAVEDWRRVVIMQQTEVGLEKPGLGIVTLCRDVYEMGFRSPRQEALDFWHSDWCEHLFDYLPSMAYSQAIRALGIPRRGDPPTTTKER